MSAIEGHSKDCASHCEWDYCTEIIGSESVMEKIDVADFPGLKKVEKERREKAGLKLFPPLLTTLTENGRPMFVLKKLIQSDGRLIIAMVRNEEEPILRCATTDGRLLMWIIRSDHVEFDDHDLDDDDGGGHDDERVKRQN